MNSSFRLGTPLRVAVLGAVFTIGFTAAGQAFTLIEFDWPVEKASLSSTTDGNSDSGNKPRFSMSDDGCEVVFTSSQTQLAPGQTDLNFANDVFLYDRCAAPFPTTTLVSHRGGTATATANGASDQPVITPNGNFVVFRSTASDIVPGIGYGGQSNVFLWDRVSDTFALVSHATGGTNISGDGSSQNGVISRTTTGRHFVAFESVARNLVPGDGNGLSDVFRYDSATFLVGRASFPNAGLPGEANGNSFNPAINGSGTCIVYESLATNLVSDQPAVDDVNLGLDVFRWTSAGPPTNILLSHKTGVPNSGRGAKTGDGPSSEPSISDDCAPPDTGRFAFKSTAKDLDPQQDDGNGVMDVFVAQNTGDSLLASHVNGTLPRRAGDDRSESPILSRNGNWVAYASLATDIAGQADTPGSSDVFVYEIGRGNTLVSHTVGDPSRVGSGPSIAPEISINGQYVAYVSEAKDLDPNQHDDNEAPDVFLWNGRWNNSIVVSRRYASLAITGERKSDRPALSGFGYSAAFTSQSSDLIADDPDLSGFDDVFHFHSIPLLMIIPHLSVRSSIDRNTLEWLTPQVNYVGMVTRFHTASPCSGFPFSDLGWTTLFTAPSPPANTRAQFTDPASFGPGAERCYGIFMARDGNPIQPADTPTRTIVARTLEDVTGVVKWGSNLAGIAALSQVGIGQNLIGVANDGGVYALDKGPFAGFWASNYWPFRTTLAPIQGRPPILNLPVRGSTRTTFVGSHDGRVYAFDADRGARAGGALWWTSPVLGSDVQSGVGGMFMMFGGVANHLLVGTRNAGFAQFFALNPATGAVKPPVYSGASAIGAINTSASVDYTQDQVVFTSLELTPGVTPSLWCLELAAAGLGGQCWAPQTLPAGISGGAIERNGTVYVGDDAGSVWAFNAASGAQPWAAFAGCGGGLGIKSFVLADRLGSAQDLYYATSANLCAVTDQGATRVLKWSIGTIPNPSAPILVRIGGIAYLYVGSSNGRLYQIEADNPAGIKSVLLRSGATVGAPAFDVTDSMVYAGSDAGVIYAVQAPLP